MPDKTSYVYLRLSAGTRQSQVDFSAIEALAASAPLQNDVRDPSVYFFALPQDIDESSAHRIISALVTTPYIDEAWRNDSVPAGFMPPVRPA